MAVPAIAAPDRDETLRRLIPVVTRWCTRLGAGRIDAEAAAADVLRVLVERWADLDPARPAEAWAWGITLRVVRRHRRLAWWRRWVPGADAAVETARATGDLGARETTRLVLRILDRLDDGQRELLVLMDLEERPAPEVAALLGIPEGTVRSRLRAARARFREEAGHLGLHLIDLLEGSDA